ncbi:Olfactory receptor 7G1 [Sciurus carolinensis]|uniref:Olfactory receptor 7G1 n=1 Tax=Sciurus carolinensis TaxID=30640 RepID=A0AA41STS7_SCICA|nr:Olfactory receptor 7G1 [Sciurus carolinensis]
MGPDLSVLLVLLSLLVSVVHDVVQSDGAAQTWRPPTSSVNVLRSYSWPVLIPSSITCWCIWWLDLFAGVPISGIISFYIHIMSVALKHHHWEYKAISTWEPHLSVDSLFYGTSFGVYISSAVTDSLRKTAVASVMYSVVPQMLNPFTYSLRSRDVREALRILIGRKVFPL